MAREIKSFTDALQGMSEEQAIRVLRREGKRLERIAKKVWRQYCESYKPKVYAEHLGSRGRRTGRAERGIKLKTRIIKVDGNHLGMEVTFENSLMYHPSVFGQKQGHAIMLISSGWKVKKGKHKDVYRFGYYEGFDYIGKVQQAFEAGKERGITLEVQWSGKYLK